MESNELPGEIKQLAELAEIMQTAVNRDERTRAGEGYCCDFLRDLHLPNRTSFFARVEKTGLSHRYPNNWEVYT